MPRPPNYRFERQQRTRDKETKKAEKRDERAARKASRANGEDPDIVGLTPGQDQPPDATDGEGPVS